MLPCHSQGDWQEHISAVTYGRRKKGENLATHEDIRKLTDQVAAVTTTTEQIKTEISDAAWNRQRRWELKREVLFEAVKRLAELEDDREQAWLVSRKGKKFRQFDR